MRFLLASALLSCSTLVFAEDGSTRLAAYETLNVPHAGQVVTFQKRAAEQGDRVDQQVDVTLTMNSTTRKPNQELEKSSTAIQRKQQRTVVVDRVEEGRTVAAQVRFGNCQRTVDGQTHRPPIAGQSFLCERNDDDTLDVSRADGTLPTPDEYELVCDSMHSLGRPNPLADYLDGKSIRVGDKLEMPEEVGDALLSGDGALGRVSKFELTLKAVDPATKVASFAIELLSEGAETTQMKLMVHGTLEIEVDTCRTRELKFNGPLGMATTIGTHSAPSTTFVSGSLNMEMSATYLDK